MKYYVAQLEMQVLREKGLDALVRDFVEWVNVTKTIRQAGKDADAGKGIFRCRELAQKMKEVAREASWDARQIALQDLKPIFIQSDSWEDDVTLFAVEGWALDGFPNDDAGKEKIIFQSIEETLAKWAGRGYTPILKERRTA